MVSVLVLRVSLCGKIARAQHASRPYGRAGSPYLFRHLYYLTREQKKFESLAALEMRLCGVVLCRGDAPC